MDVIATKENHSPAIMLSEDSKRLLTNLIEDYVSHGFGTFNKNDFETLIFYALVAGGTIGKSNYEISRLLRIPESKVRRLQYEIDLKYNHDKTRWLN